MYFCQPGDFSIACQVSVTIPFCFAFFHPKSWTWRWWIFPAWRRCWPWPGWPPSHPKAADKGIKSVMSCQVMSSHLKWCQWWVAKSVMSIAGANCRSAKRHPAEDQVSRINWHQLSWSRAQFPLIWSNSLVTGMIGTRRAAGMMGGWVESTTSRLFGNTSGS